MNDDIKQLKAKRESLSCKLSIMRREIGNPNINNERLCVKIGKGIEMSQEFQEITNKLVQLGCKLNSKAPYLFPDWWKQQCAENKSKDIKISKSENNICENTHSEKINIDIIKKALKEVLNDSNLGQKETTYNYNINLAWVGDIDETNINIMLKYLSGMGAGLQYSTVDDERHEYLCKYSTVCNEAEYKYMIKSSQLLIELLNLNNLEIYGKKCT